MPSVSRFLTLPVLFFAALLGMFLAFLWSDMAEGNPGKILFDVFMLALTGWALAMEIQVWREEVARVDGNDGY